jgi:dihydrofolate reductase
MEWLGPGPTAGEFRPDSAESRIVFDECMATGAVITGRRTGDFAGYWGGDHHDGVPIFVPAHRAPADNPHPRVHYVTEGIAACVAQAKEAAGDRDVMMHGAYTAQECLKAGLLGPDLAGAEDPAPAVRGEARMSGPLRLYMSMSLDGFITGPDDRKGQGLGHNGGRLFNWLDDRMSAGPSGQIFREAMATGAVIAGRRTFELADRWHGDHHDGATIHILTHRVDDGGELSGNTTFHSDVAACAAQARAAAGDRAVLVHGAGAAQSLLRAGELDELEIHLVPVLLGAGRRLFGATEPAHNELELVRRLEARDVTHLRYRVAK